MKIFFKKCKKEIILFLLSLVFACVFPAIIFMTFSLKYYSFLMNKMGNLILLTDNTFFTTLINNRIIYNLIFFVGSFIILQTSQFFSGYLSSKSIPYITRSLKKKAFDHALELPLENFKDKNSSNIEKNVLNFSDSILNLMGLSFFFIENISAISTILFMVFGVKSLFIFVVFWIMAILFIGYILLHPIANLSSEREILQNEQSGFMSECLQNIVVYKIFSCKHFINNSFNKIEDKDMKLSSRINLRFGSTRFIFGMTNILCLSLGIIFIIHIKMVNVEIDALLFFNWFFQLTVKFWAILWNALPLFFLIGKVKSSLEFINTKLDHKNENLQKIQETQQITIKNLNFQYSGSPILKNFSLNISKEFILIQGKSGSGKSTILNLILQLEKTPKKTIFINNVDITNISNLYENISYLPQNDLIFNKSVGDNIVLDKPYDERKFKYLYDILELNDIVPFSETFNRSCGAVGTKISGGQAKRISICRMLLFDKPDNILILDEPFNNLSQNIIDKFLLILEKEKQNRIIIAIDHSNALLSLKDRILNL